MSADAPPNFTDWLQTHLTRRSWRQKDLARRLGITEAHMSRIATGERRPTTDMCALLAQAFGESVEDVYRVAGHPIPSSEPRVPSTEDAVEADRRFTRAQKELLLGIIRSWIGGNHDA